ncbi:prepilin-type N-terminal cleavage/methylation domain-containing protein [Candidatus Daviesbacteria bacterium]|nr:prepilin-type N-terminal cleavage/methylation domain-containing protein [Candidatus Daviesbacteria bacterium]
MQKLKLQFKNQNGQSLVELIVVATVAVIVVGALTFATIAALRNAAFSKNQTKATKLAQDGLERVRTSRDRGLEVDLLGNPDKKFSDLWGLFLTRDSCSDKPCLFELTATGSLQQINIPTDVQEVEGLRRYIEISDQAACPPLSSNECYKFQKQISAVVTWTDFSGPHESRLTTILRNQNI